MNRQNILRRKEETSIHEILKTQINEIDKTITDDAGFKFQVNRPSSEVKTITNINEYGVDDRYFYIDSNNKELISQENGKLIFNLFKLGNFEPLENIIEMQITPFKIEKYPTDERFIGTSPVIIKKAIPNYYSEKITMLIEEMKSQSIVADNNINYHFELKVIPDELDILTRQNLIPEDNGLYIFSKPIKSLEKMTLIFRDPTEQIILKSDILQGYFQSGRSDNGAFSLPVFGGTLGTITGGYKQSIFWIQNVFSAVEFFTYQFPSRITYNIKFVNMDLIKVIEPDKKTDYINYFTRPQGHLGGFNMLYPTSNQPPFLPTIISPPPPVSFIGPLYGYFIFDNIIVPRGNGGDYYPTTNIQVDTFYPATISVECRRINFGIRFRTLSDVKTNRITPI